jgi:glycosyltransferase involved in cell wall biosynthesis
VDNSIVSKDIAMRIAQVASLMLPVPPVGYGGSERIISYITEELVRLGHDVVLFATGDSQTKARLVAGSPQSIIYDDWRSQFVSHFLMFEQVYKHADEFDVIHNHFEHFHAPFARRHRTPTVTTVHNSIDGLQDAASARLFEYYREQNLVSISNIQRNAFPALNWQATVYHGLPEELYTFQPQPGKYLAFLGRIVEEKGVVDAIEIALRAEMPLKIAGNPGLLEEAHFEQIKERFKHPLIEYLGEVNDAEKQELLGNAAALLFPIKWDEPFGLVMIESLACGTPVIAYNRGSVPEIIVDQQNGLIVDSIEEAVAAVHEVSRISRQACRATFDARFTVRQMVQQYCDLYERLIQQVNETQPLPA